MSHAASTPSRSAASTAAAPASSRRVFELVLIKPSHYDDDGYLIQWVRSFIPSNTLAALYGLAEDCRERRVLGEDVEIRVTTVDETNTRVRTGELIAKIRSASAGGLVGLVGVQSNQFPRALDIASGFRAAGVAVVIGGFHVSGCMAMLPGMQADLQRALDMGVSLFAGEAEGRLDRVLIDASTGALEPVYDHLAELPDIGGAPVPFLPGDKMRATLGVMGSFDAGRGCPFQCSFCTIINVQGRKSRRRTPDDVEKAVRRGLAEGVDRFFITDDDFARNEDWEAILDRLIAIRREPGNKEIIYTVQVDTQAHKIPRFLEKLGRAHVINVFIGLENINPDNLLSANKRQNKITDYRELLQACKRNGLGTIGGYILGFPHDTVSSILRDVEIIKRELAIDILEFFLLTPLPGSQDHQRLAATGVDMDADLNRYDLSHPVTAHPLMSREEWARAYRLAWESFYSPEHCERVMWRAASRGIHPNRLYFPLAFYPHSVLKEGLHPLDGGLFRRKRRGDRRPGLPRESPLVFYPRYARDFVRSIVAFGWAVARLARAGRRIMNHPRLFDYEDASLTPIDVGTDEDFEMFTQTEAARKAVGHRRRVERLTAGAKE